ncbi:hypothetical protein L9F63_020821, partial [Diploptera punctata]
STGLESNDIGFLEAPVDNEVIVGKALLLKCRANTTLEECQWSWTSLDDDKNATFTVVKKYPPFGDNVSDCSVKFSSVLMEQQGFWICGIRSKGDGAFMLATPAKLLIKYQILFSELTKDTIFESGQKLLLLCKTQIAVKECKWTWRSLNSKNTSELTVQTFAAFGNESQDCSMHLNSVLAEQAGYWTCGARNAEENYTQARSIKLTLRKPQEGVEFVQLSRDIQVAIGEPILLRCVTNTAVELCQWSWKHLNRTNDTAVVVKQFPAFGEEGRDCSVRFKSVLEEQEGIWICAVRLYTHSAFVTASPATLTLLPAVRVKFLERPEDVRVAIGESVLLRCIATTAVSECMWTWQPLSEPNKTELIVKRFPAFGNHSRDCSVRFRNVLREQEGLWGCTVTGPPNRTQLAASPAKLTVFDPVPINFVELSQDVQMPPGGRLVLRCVTDIQVEECKWSWQPLDETNTTEIQMKKFPAFGNDSRDCSLSFDAVMAEHEGNWTCAARNADETHFKSAPPARITLLQPDAFFTTLWSAPEHKVTLACRLSAPRPTAVCHWQHLPNNTVISNKTNDRYIMDYKKSSGICTVVFTPEMDDLGQWSCMFTINDWEIASATLVLLTTPADEKLSWLVGVLAAMVLLLTVLLVAAVVCRCRKQNSLDKNGLGNPVLSGNSGDKKNADRYADSPSKINFQFEETPGNSTPAVTANPQHIYERVDRYVSPVTCKSIYENVE